MARSLYRCASLTPTLDPGGTIKITVWLATRERSTWIATGEILGLALLLYSGPGPWLRMIIGLPLLAHLGYTAMTSLPMGAIPGRPIGAKRYRRNQDLRSHVIGFLNEVRRVEEYAQRARDAGLPPKQVERALLEARERMMAAAAQAVAQVGKATAPPPEFDTEAGRGRATLLTHATTPGGSATGP